MLPVVSPDKILALHLQPIDDGIGVFLHRGGEDDEVIPFTDLAALSVKYRNMAVIMVPSSENHHNKDAYGHNTTRGLGVQSTDH